MPSPSGVTRPSFTPISNMKILYTLIFRFLYSRQEDKYSEFNLFLISP
jgi:hypothetical protein